MRRGRGCAAPLWLVAMATIAAAGGGVECDGGRVTGTFVDVPAGDAVRQLAVACRVRVAGDVDRDLRVSAALDDVAVDEALARIVGRSSFVVVYRDGRPVSVTVVSAARTTRRIEAIAPEPEPPVAAVPAAGPAAWGSALKDGTAIVLDPKLQKVLGTERATFAELLGVAYGDPRQAARRWALRLAMRTIERDPAILGRLFQPLEGMDARRIAASARAVGGPDAEHAVRAAANKLRDPALRARADEVLRELRTSDAP